MKIQFHLLSNRFILRACRFSAWLTALSQNMTFTAIIHLYYQHHITIATLHFLHQLIPCHLDWDKHPQNSIWLTAFASGITCYQKYKWPLTARVFFISPYIIYPSKDIQSLHSWNWNLWIKISPRLHNAVH